MTNSDFPIKQSNTLGQFWLPGAEDKTVTGVLEVSGPEIRLEVSPGLTPMHTFEALGAGRWAVKTTEDPVDMVVLGSIPLRPGRVTIWDAYTTHRQAIGMPMPLGGEQPSAHELTATWCLVGDHLPDPYTRIYGVRPYVTNLAEWAWIPALATTFYPDNRLRLDWHLAA